jgi:1,4-alpha-glucan branching enzyme
MRRRKTTAIPVVFSLDAPAAQDVSIAGTFNDWEPQVLSQDQDGLWQITLRLAQGAYEYKFLVDAEWQEDPNNPRRTPNSFGSYNSICEVS